MLILSREANGSLFEVCGDSSSDGFGVRYQRAITAGSTELEIRIDFLVSRVHDESSDGAFNTVRTQNYIGLRCRSVLKMDHCATRYRIWEGDVCASLVKVSTLWVNMQD